MEDRREVRKTMDAVNRIHEEAETLYDRHLELKDTYHEAISKAGEANKIHAARDGYIVRINVEADGIQEDFITNPTRRNLDRMVKMGKKMDAANQSALDAHREEVDAQALIVSIGADFLESLQALYEKDRALVAASRANTAAGLREYEKQLAEYERAGETDEPSLVN